MISYIGILRMPASTVSGGVESTLIFAPQAGWRGNAATRRCQCSPTVRQPAPQLPVSTASKLTLYQNRTTGTWPEAMPPMPRAHAQTRTGSAAHEPA